MALQEGASRPETRQRRRFTWVAILVAAAIAATIMFVRTGVRRQEMDARGAALALFRGGEVSSVDPDAAIRGFLRTVTLDPSRLAQAIAAMKLTYADYLALEEKSTEARTDETGRLHVKIEIPQRDWEHLQNTQWSRLDYILAPGEQAAARRQQHLLTELFPNGNVNSTLEIWQSGKWFHWRIDRKPRDRRSGSPVNLESSGPNLPSHLQRLWDRYHKLDPEAGSKSHPTFNEEQSRGSNSRSETNGKSSSVKSIASER